MKYSINEMLNKTKIIPNLVDYDIDPITGFMPNPPPLTRLSGYFEEWELLMDHLNALVLSAKLRHKIADLNLLNVDKLESKAEERRAFLILAFMAQSYIHGVSNFDKPIDILPRQIAIPWFKVAAKLNINPMVSYSSTVLWNWYLIDKDGPRDLR